MPTNLTTIPWLDNGMLAQLPVRMGMRRIAPANRFPDGSILYAASDAKLQYDWTLSYENLNDQELQRFADFFVATQSASASFAFYDPLGNMLTHSGNLQSSAWIAPSALVISPFVDPQVEGAFILTNPTSQPLTLSQSASVAGAFAVCFSVLTKWEGGASVALSLSDGGTTETRTLQAGAWTRNHVVKRGVESTVSRTAAIVVPPHTQLIVAAPQLEIASRPNAYVETGVHSGVFAAAWLSQKQIDLQSPAPGAHSIILHIESIRQS